MSMNGHGGLDDLASQAAHARAEVDPWARTVSLAPLGAARGALSVMGGMSPDGTAWVRLIHDHDHGTDVMDLIVEDPEGNRISELIAEGILQATTHAESGIVQAQPKQGPSRIITP